MKKYLEWLVEKVGNQLVSGGAVAYFVMVAIIIAGIIWWYKGC